MAIITAGHRCLAATIRVPEDVASIQKAIDAADKGDTVLVAPGTYSVKLQFKGEKKEIRLGSWFLTTGDRKYIEETVLKAKWTRSSWLKFSREYVIEVPPDAAADSIISGFTIKNANDGVRCLGKVQILNNIFLNCRDGVDYEESSGGICGSNVFTHNRDDGIDLDHAVEVVIENNLIFENRDDGIEIRLHPYRNPDRPPLEIVIRNNIISENGEDGIQLIDYSTDSMRIFRIERNLFYGNAMAAIGCMGDADTEENYEAFPLPERAYVINNSFVDNNYGLLGGKNMVVLNNIFAGTENIAIKNVAGGSVVAYTAFWKNGIDFENSNVDRRHSFFTNPRLTSDHRLDESSPCIDLGADHFTFNGETIVMPKSAFRGPKPDLGAFER